MNKKDIIKEFKDSGAMLEGHFILSSGLHSSTYLQCARVMMDPKRSKKLCEALTNKIYDNIGKDAIDLVVSPAMGGILVGYELGRQMNLPSIFTERVNNIFELRRGFEIYPGARVLIAEDIITTGKSSLECINCIKGYGAHIVGISCLIDRSDKKIDLDYPIFSLTSLSIPSYSSDNLPEKMKKIKPIKPGSRGLE